MSIHELLTHEEIKALLSTLSHSETGPETNSTDLKNNVPRLYDFARRHRSLCDQMPMLELIY
jgi:flagellar motor switch protein FliM